jgi:hypothetical protein
MADVKPNAELAYKVLDHIDAHPEQWIQDLWWIDAQNPGSHCGSAGCFAGWVVTLSGGQIEYSRFDIQPIVTGLPDLDGASISEAAAELLNVNPWVIDPDRDNDEWNYDNERYLFSGGNDRDDLGRIVELLFGPRPAGTP